MRGKKVAINTIFSLIEEFVAIVCGFILPKLILSAFGSKYNGLITSITQFLTCAVLLRSGIGGATRAALYKPLASKNKEEIDSIVKATDIFMRKIGIILAISILVFSLIYPFFVRNDFDWFFSFTLFLIIGASTFAESFFGITYLIVLQADQKVWVSSLMKSICYILNTIIAAILIYLGFGIHAVKLGSAFVYVLYPIILQAYVKRKYDINSNVKPNNKSISQRWDAFWHQVATFTMSNTDIIVLTIFTNMLEVSVYSVYRLVTSGLERFIQSFSSGLEAAFGNMIARDEDDIINSNVSIMEVAIYSISTVIYTVAVILILQFVSVYTRGINDVNYSRPLFAYIILIAQFFNSIRIPYQTVVQAAGHYKQTRNGAILEPIINITISVILVIKYGLIGVAVGTLIAALFRTVQYSVYMSKKIVNRSVLISLFNIILSFIEAFITIFIVNILNLKFATNYFMWAVNAIIVLFVATMVVILGNILFHEKEFNSLIKKIKNIFKTKRKIFS